ncbi:MAG: serine/threonine transporter SstT [Saezia sp.]
MENQNPLIRLYRSVSLVQQIAIGLVGGILLALVSKEAAGYISIFGTLFISALKSVAPVLVLILVANAIASHRKGTQSNTGQLVMLYLVGMFAASVIAVIVSYLFPSNLGALKGIEDVGLTAPNSVKDVMMTLVGKMIDNPFNAVVQANYIGLIVWGIGLGIALRHATETTKTVVNDLSESIMFIVRIVIRCAPLGVFGLVASTVADAGIENLLNYVHVIVVLVGCMAFVALVVNPLIMFVISKRNPYPLVFAALRESGIPAFFTRSSAANIPVNMEFCKKHGFDEEVYSVGVPLGAAINMSGAAITISVLTLATAYTLGVKVDIPSALLLSVVSAVCACGASGVAGGSLLLIPVACSMFNISNDIAMQVVAIGVMIGVVQDSVETAVNSSTDVMFIGAIDQARKNKIV